MSKILNFLSGHEDSLESWVEQYRTLDRELKKLTLDCSLLKAKIIQRMGDADHVENKQGLVIATYKDYQREDFDKKSFSEANPDQYSLYIKITPYKMFKLK